MQHSVAHRVGPGLVDFHEIRALLVLLPDHRDDLIRVVGVVGVRQDVLRRIEVIGILVAADEVDGIARKCASAARG